MDLGPDLTPYEEEMPKAWQDMLDEMEKSGGNINHREAIKARIDIAITADQIMHEQYEADKQRKHEQALENRREAFAKAMADRTEKFQKELDDAEQARHQEAMDSAVDDRRAAEAAATAAGNHARALNKATYILAVATIVLVIVTAVSIFKPGS